MLKWYTRAHLNERFSDKPEVGPCQLNTADVVVFKVHPKGRNGYRSSVAEIE